MKVYITAIAGIVPNKMVQCLSAFMNACYIFRRNTISSTALHQAQEFVEAFHRLRDVFIEEGVRESISLPRQHALVHYVQLIIQFGSPNGLCSSITESKHIKAVKEPWRRSSRFKALVQMLRCIIRLEKMGALRRQFRERRLLVGSTAASFSAATGIFNFDHPDDMGSDFSDSNEDLDVFNQRSCSGSPDERINDAGPENGPQTIRSVSLAATPGV